MQNRILRSNFLNSQLCFLLSSFFLASSVYASPFNIKGYEASSNPSDGNTALLARFGELIARERAFGEVAQELASHNRGSSRFEMNTGMLNAALGDDFFDKYDQVVPKIESLGEKSRRDQIALRIDPANQTKLAEGERVAGINAGAVNNVIAHYKIAIEKLDVSLQELLLAESHMIRRSAEELSNAIDENGRLMSYPSYARAGNLLSAIGQIKGFVQPRCNLEADVWKKARDTRYDVEDQFYFNENNQLNVSVQGIYDAAGQVESQAMLLSEDGSHCG